jgi:hypothetical protein
MLRNGRLMSEFEEFQKFFEQLQVPDCPRRHWSMGAEWEMTESIAHVICEHTKVVVGEAKVFNLSADEVTSINGQSWLSIHIYISIGFKRVSILLALMRLVDGNSADVVKESIYAMLLWHIGLSQAQVAERLICFVAHGVSMFQGCMNDVIRQLKEYVAPFLFGVHCMAHRTNLEVEPLSRLPLVSKLETLCQAMYNYFKQSSKKHLEFQKLANLVETKGLSILRNVKTRWISLLEPLKRVLGEYKTLIVKMYEDAVVKQPEMTVKQTAARESARSNYDLLCDVGTLLALSCILPLLESVNSLMKFSHSNHVFMSDYVAAVKIC